MATVDTDIRFNKFNSLKLESGEVSWSTKFEVEFYSVLTVQAQVLCLDGSATGQFIMRWLDEDGKKLSDDTDGFDIENRWRRRTATFEVPEGAVQCMFALENTDGINAIHVACAMAEAGEIASAFDPSLASQTALLDAHGLYVGTVSAYQVIAGILQSLDMRAYFDLEKPEIVMKGKDATWKASPENPLRLEDDEGEFIGGYARVNGDINFITSMMRGRQEGQEFVKIGTQEIEVGGSPVEVRGLVLYNENGIPIGYFALRNDSLIIDASSSAVPAVDITDKTVQIMGQERNISITAGGSMTGIYIMTDDPDFPTIKKINILVPNGGEIRNLLNNHAVGIDNVGPYFVKAGSKTYF